MNYMNYRQNIDGSKNMIDLKQCIYLINKKIYNFVGSGRQANVYKVHSDLCGSCVIKIYDMENREKVDQEKKIAKEYHIMKKLNILINSNVCPNFIMLYTFMNYMLTMEYADSDCTFLTKKYDNNIFTSFVMQILFGLLCFHKKTEYIHYDVKLENILFKNIDKNIVFNYIVNGVSFKIKTYGYLFMISDFGSCVKKNYDKNNGKLLTVKDDIKLFYKMISNVHVKHDTEYLKKIVDEELYSKNKSFYNILIKFYKYVIEYSIDENDIVETFIFDI